ncbi:MAG: CAP domain-containing protein [Actinobacteria bacterium]|nr:CAP domain-containing protein [Actinomycetota bacterium]MBV9254572.1 CAP domain-containing protein [Actinomycetota bacterium]
MRGLALVVAALLGSITMAVLGATAASATPAVDEASFLVKINALRVSQGLVPLTLDAHLIDIARNWSAKMASDGAISHNPDLAAQVGGNGWRTLGENVGVGSTVDWLENAFENSPHHYANLVDPDYRWIGLGVVEANGQVWVTEDFEQPKTVVSAAGATKPAAAPAPKVVSTPKPTTAPRPATPKVTAAPKPAVTAPPTTAKPPVTAPPTTAAAATPAPTTPPTVLGLQDGENAAAPGLRTAGTSAGTPSAPLLLVAVTLLIGASAGVRRQLIKR